MTTIRRAAPGDAEAIARVWYEAWSDGHTGHVPDGLLAHRQPEHFAWRAAERVGHSWVAEVDGEVVGFVTVEGDELEQIFVLRRARGTGVATDLLRTGEDAIRAAGHDVAWLAVVAGNARARAFYERQGGSTPASWPTRPGPTTAPSSSPVAATSPVTPRRPGGRRARRGRGGCRRRRGAGRAC